MFSLALTAASRNLAIYGVRVPKRISSSILSKVLSVLLIVRTGLSTKGGIKSVILSSLKVLKVI